MSTDDFTEAARIIDAHRENERWVGDGVKIECVCGHTSHATFDLTSGPITEDNNNHRDAERMHAQHVAQVLAEQSEDPSGPLRPLTTDERSYRYAQGLGYELPEEPR